MNIQLIRHATLRIEYGGATFWIDPMFSAAGANPPVVHTSNDRRNPLVPLPFEPKRMPPPDAVFVTHNHPDHWDEAAAAALAKSTPIYCQPEDVAVFASAGFADVRAVETAVRANGVDVVRTSGRHGTGDIGKAMGPVSGFVFRAAGEPTLYVAGDTIWCAEVERALDEHRPDVTIVNAGGARFAVGDPITMDADGVVAVCRYAPWTKVIAVHMDAINHCLVTRADLRARLAAEELLDRVAVPEDGETAAM